MCDEVCSLALPITFGVAGICVLFCGMVWYCYHITYKQPYQSSYRKRPYRQWMTSTTSLVPQPEKTRDYLKNLITDRFLYHTHIKDYTEDDLKELRKISPSRQEACVICQMKYKPDSDKVFVGLLKSCAHYFHFECIWAWLQQKQNCPVCRNSCVLDETNLRGFSLEQVLSAVPNSTTGDAGDGDDRRLAGRRLVVSEADSTADAPCSDSEKENDDISKRSNHSGLPDVEETAALEVDKISVGYLTV